MARSVKVRNLESTIAAQSQKVMGAKVNAALSKEFEKAKRSLLKDFDNHGVTQELSTDSGSENPAEKSSNYLDYGNLFSFLGIDEGTDVTEIVRETLDMVTRIKRGAKFSHTIGKRFVFDVQVQYPTQEELNDATRILEWTSKGVVDLIQNGSPGYTKYLFSIIRKFKNSRSGTAIQTKKGDMRNGSFRGTKWTNEVLQNFQKRLSNI